MTGFFEAVFKFFIEFSWRKLLAVVVVVAVTLVGVSIYERYTSSFRFSRLQKATDLLVRLQDLQTRSTNSTPALERARTALMTQAVQAIEEKPLTLEFIPGKLTFSLDSLWRFAAGSSLWFILALFQVRKIATKEGRDAIRGLVAMAFLSGGVGMFVPGIWWPWFHLLVYPWLLIAVVLLALAPFAIVAALRSAKKKALQINCANNLKQVGVAAKTWALEHQDVLPRDFASMKPYLGTDLPTRCPCTPYKQYDILSPGAVGAAGRVVYARCTIHNNVLLANGSVHLVEEGQVVNTNGTWSFSSPPRAQPAV